MPDVPKQKISVTIAIDALREGTDDAKNAERAYRRAMDERNRMIRDARLAGVRSRVLEAITGLSRERVYKITYAHQVQEDR